jgi:hypothetical protein
VSEAAPPQRAQRAEGAPLRLPRTTNRRLNTIIEIAYRGGSESKWNVKCHGQRYVLPGWMALEDVMALLHHEVSPHA